MTGFFNLVRGAAAFQRFTNSRAQQANRWRLSVLPIPRMGSFTDSAPAAGRASFPPGLSITGRSRDRSMSDRHFYRRSAANFTAMDIEHPAIVVAHQTETVFRQYCRHSRVAHNPDACKRSGFPATASRSLSGRSLTNSNCDR